MYSPTMCKESLPNIVPGTYQFPPPYVGSYPGIMPLMPGLLSCLGNTLHHKWPQDLHDESVPPPPRTAGRRDVLFAYHALSRRGAPYLVASPCKKLDRVISPPLQPFDLILPTSKSFLVIANL